MNARRVVLLITCLVVAGLAVLIAVTQWDRANRIATVVSALAAVAAVGVALWAALPGTGTTVRVSRTGSATATGRGQTNSGVTGPATGVTGRVEADQTGTASASDDGDANSGIWLT